MFFYTKNVLASLAVLAVISGCAQNPATGGYNFVTIDEEEEYSIGHVVAQRAIKESGLYKEKPEFTKYYRRLGAEIVGVSERPEVPFDFLLLNNNNFNAWASPGYVSMNRGIIPYFNSEAEMVAVMAHEVGHITARHTVRKKAMRDVKNKALSAIGFSTVTSDAKPEDKAIVLAAASAVNKAAALGLFKYSRSAENEADMLAARYMEQLGYNPKEAYNVFRAMHNNRELDKKIFSYYNDGEELDEPLFYSLMYSHPDPKERMKSVVKRAGKPNVNKVPDTQDHFFDMIDGMAWGPDIRTAGAAGENRMYFPRARMYWESPDDFHMLYSTNGWKAYSQSRDTFITITTKKVDHLADAEEILRTTFPGVFRVESILVDCSIPAYTGIQRIKVEDSFFSKDKFLTRRIFAVKAKSRIGKDTTQAYFFVYEPKEKALGFAAQDADFFDSMRTMRQLTKEESEQIQPMRIKIHTVQEGETVASLSEKMAMGSLKREWFSVLNNIDKETPNIKVGQRVKLVVDPNVHLPFLK